MTIAALAKPSQTWCSHCEIGVGCSIYADRPDACRTFYCAYRHSADLGEEWRPTTAHMVVNYEKGRNRINVTVDADHPSIWRSAPYFQQIKTWAANILQRKGHLVVWDSGKTIVVLPDHEAVFENIADQQLVILHRKSAAGDEYKVLAVAQDDPRLSSGGDAHWD